MEKQFVDLGMQSLFLSSHSLVMNQMRLRGDAGWNIHDKKKGVKNQPVGKKVVGSKIWHDQMNLDLHRMNISLLTVMMSKYSDIRIL